MLTKKFLFVSVIILTLLFGFTSDNSSREANRILGIWQTEEKNLQIEMIEGDGYYAGRMIWFLCASGESMMFSY
ncbi:MAG: hypothetical protein HY015_01350, partial [Bacteroidetes bacterium]|nr:hypothetical protein [Bacteroidota bacterium]